MGSDGQGSLASNATDQHQQGRKRRQIISYQVSGQVYVEHKDAHLYDRDRVAKLRKKITELLEDAEEKLCELKAQATSELGSRSLHAPVNFQVWTSSRADHNEQ